MQPETFTNIVNIGSIIGTIVTIFSVILAIYFYVKSDRKKEPCWTIRSTVLVRDYIDEFNELRVTYAGSEVKNLTISRILFWNQGKQTIDGSDIPSLAPLSIISKNSSGELLNASIIAANNSSSAIQVKLSSDRKSAILVFDYLDSSQGAVIQVVHTGIGSKSLEVVGTIKGVKYLKKRKIRVFRNLPLPTPLSFDRKFKPRTRRLIMAGLMALICLILWFTLGYVAYRTFYPLPQPKVENTTSNHYLDLVGFSINALFMLYIVVDLISHGPPKGLEAYEDDFKD